MYDLLFHLKYCEYCLLMPLGEDSSDLCNSLSCPQTGSATSEFHFCVLKENVSNPTVCETLNETHCPGATFGFNWIGYPCLEGRIKGESLCVAFARKQKILYTSVYREFCESRGKSCFRCYGFLVFFFLSITESLKVTSELSRGKRIYLGSIGEFGSFNFSCDHVCKLKCTDKTYNDEYDMQIVNDQGRLSARNDRASFVSRMWCRSSGSF